MLISSSICFATEQQRDSLVYNGKGYYIENRFLFEEILSDFVRKEGIITDDYFYTANWRGYVAVFEITNNKLQLKDLKSYIFNEKDSLSYLKSVVNDKIKEKINSIKLDDILLITEDDLVYGYKYYNEVDYEIIEIQSNNVTQNKKFTFSELDKFKDEQFLKFKKTKEFKEELKDCKKFKKEQIKDYSNPNLLNHDEEFRLRLLDDYRNFDCDDFIKGKMFSQLFDIYRKIL